MLSSANKFLRKRHVYPRFVLGSNDDGRELNVESKELTDKRVNGHSIPFSAVNMKWGYRKLKDYDMLIRACNGQKYYLAIHVWGSKYKLNNKKDCDFSKDFCSDLTDLTGMDLNFTPKNGSGSGQEEKLGVTLKNCKFQWSNVDSQKPDDWTLTMDCESEKYENKRWEKNNSNSVSLVLKKDSHKFEYNPERKSSTLQETARH